MKITNIINIKILWIQNKIKYYIYIWNQYYSKWYYLFIKLLIIIGEYIFILKSNLFQCINYTWYQNKILMNKWIVLLQNKFCLLN